MQVLQERRTSRTFSNEDVPLQTLSNLLWAAFGINRPELGKRTAPSANNWQEFDIYVAMDKGVYLYDAQENLLRPVLPGNIHALTGKQDFVEDAPINLIFVANYAKMGNASTEAKDFYSATDVGFISQNVYLFCASEGLATVVRGWFDKEALAKKMQLEPEQKVILCQTVGYPGD
jgi:SagB-type dehydrogenase family enzyme